MRVTLLSCFLLVLIPAAAQAQEGVDWASTPPLSGTVDGADVRIEGAGVHPLVVIDDPAIEGDSYAIAATVRYEGVVGDGYLEMWSHFPDGGAFFSRTLAETGPLAALSGDSTERPIEVPFFLNGAAAPERVEINLVLPADGTVWVSPLSLVGFGGAAPWFSEQQAAWGGATAGMLAGLGGAAIGIVAGRRRNRRLVEVALAVGLAVGVVSLAAGGIAFVASQPRHVWYPLVLIGLVLTFVDGLLLPGIRRSYAAAELHRIRAMDA